MNSEVIIFDKENKVQDFLSIAKDIDNNDVIGWIVIERPWYSHEDQWKYWIYFTNSCKGGDNLDRCLVKKETIKPFTQIEEIKHLLDNGLIVILTKEFLYEERKENILAIITNKNEIPYELWEGETVG